VNSRNKVASIPHLTATGDFGSNYRRATDYLITEIDNNNRQQSTTAANSSQQPTANKKAHSVSALFPFFFRRVMFLSRYFFLEWLPTNASQSVFFNCR